MAQAAGIIGAVGITLGAALASLLGVYLAAAAVAGIARYRGEFRVKALAITAAA